VIFAPKAPPLEQWNGRFEVTDRQTVTSGLLRMHGTLDLGVLQGQFRYHGRLCMWRNRL
jgi:hypothetical protein